MSIATGSAALAAETNQASQEDVSNVDQAELALKSLEDDDDWENVDRSSDDHEGLEDFSDDDMLLAMDNMYGTRFYDSY